MSKTDEKKIEDLCPGCATPVDEGEKCPHCSALHHPACWDFHEGCAILGCDEKSHLPNDTAERDKLYEECKRAVSLARRLWTFLMVGSLSFLLSFFILILSFASPTLGLAWLTAPLERLGQPLLLVVAIISMMLFAILGLWLLYVQSKLEKATSSSLQAPITMPIEICDNLELPVLQQRLVELGDRVAALSVLVAFLTLVFSTTFIKNLKLPLAPTILVVALGLGLPWLALSLAREQSFFVLTLESRVNASFEKTKQEES